MNDPERVRCPRRCDRGSLRFVSVKGDPFCHSCDGDGWVTLPEGQAS
jgi:hypothetical protein